jgi:hypothetical protein
MAAATLENQELIKDGDDGDFDPSTDSLHDIREYLESMFGSLSAAITGTHTITVAHGTIEQTIVTLTPTRNLAFAAYFDVNTLVTAGEGGTLTFRLKLQIDGVTLRTIDLSSFVVGTDEIHPSVSGFSDIGANTISLTVQCSIAVSANRTVPYRILGGIS